MTDMNKTKCEQYVQRNNNTTQYGNENGSVMSSRKKSIYKFGSNLLLRADELLVRRRRSYMS